MHVFRRFHSWYFEFVFRRRRHRRGGFPTRHLAEDAGHAARRQLAERRIEQLYGVRDTRGPKAVPTLAAYVRGTYEPHHLPRLAPATQKTARSQIGKLVAALGTYALDDLTPALLDRYATARLAHVSASQVAEEVTRLSRIVNHARARGVLDRHPFRGWIRPKADRRDIRIVTPGEERALLRHAPKRFRDWIPLALDTGLRKGELRILERNWVTLAAGELRIMQPKVKRPKVIPLTARARAVLAARLRSVNGTALLFPRPDGCPWSLPWIDRQWAAACRAAGLAGIRFHDLRHTFATRLVERGASPATVGELLGHKPPYSTTLRYFHPLPEAKRRAIARLMSPRKPPPRAGSVRGKARKPR